MDEASQRLTSGHNADPVIDQNLPEMLSEYGATRGGPSEENIAGILLLLSDTDRREKCMEPLEKEA